MKKHNFNAGPSILPREVIEQTAQAVLDFNGANVKVAKVALFIASGDIVPSVTPRLNPARPFLSIPFL